MTRPQIPKSLDQHHHITLSPVHSLPFRSTPSTPPARPHPYEAHLEKSIESTRASRPPPGMGTISVSAVPVESIEDLCDGCSEVEVPLKKVATEERRRLLKLCGRPPLPPDSLLMLP